MPSSCCVVFCTSGYKSNPEKVSMFQFPKNEILREKWEKSIPRANLVINPKTVICEKHFTHDQIVRTWESGSGASKVMINLKRAKLAHDAVPSIFPGPKYLSKPVKKRKLPSKRVLCSSINEVSDDLLSSSNDDTQKKICIESISQHFTSKENEYYPEVVFSEIFANPTIVLLPKGWECRSSNGKNMFVTFYYLVPYFDGTPGFIIQKQVSFGKEMVLSCKIHDHLIDFNTFGIIVPKSPSINDISNILKIINSYNVCIGRPCETQYLHVPINTVNVNNGRLRHMKCPYLLLGNESKKQSCLYCLQLSSAYRMRKKRILDNNKCELDLSYTNKRLQVLRKNKHIIQKKVLRVKFRVKQLQEKLNEAKENLDKVSSKTIEDLIKTHNLNDSQSVMIKEIVSASKFSNPKNRRYSENWLLLCLLFHIRASGAYKFLRDQKLLPLPCITTIQKYISIVKTNCGFDEQFFELLKKRMSKKSEKHRHGMLLFDEVQLRKGIYVNTRNLSYSGLEDLGDDIKNSDKKADHGLVLMFQSLTQKFSQPIAVFASHGTVPGLTLAQIVLKAIVLLEKSNCIVDGIVCGASTNRKLWTEFGVCGIMGNVKNYFAHPSNENRKVYAFSDVPHLFKNIRNRLHDKKILQVKPGSKPIRWDHYIETFNADSVHPGIARAVPKVTRDHLFLSNIMKMRVRLMTQVFSRSMASGIEFYRRRNVLALANSEETQHWTLFLNNLFDAMNRRYTAEGIKQFGNDLTIMEDAEKWLNDWESCLQEGVISQDEYLSMSRAEGLRVTLRSTIELTNHLLSECGFEYVLTGKMNQDPLEKFFGMIRQAAGPNDHPTGPTFLHLYRILSLYSVLSPPKYGNCTILDNHAPKISVTELKDIFQSNSTENSERKIKLKNLESKVDTLVKDGQWEADEIFEDHNYNSAEALDCIIYYACGYISRKLSKTTSCLLCSKALKSNNAYVALPEAELVNLKSKGGLVHPNINLFYFLSKVENSFAKHCNKRNVFDLAIDEIFENFVFTFPCETHKICLVSSIISNYLEMRMRHYAVQENRKEKIAQKKKKLAKLSNV